MLGLGSHGTRVSVCVRVCVRACVCVSFTVLTCATSPLNAKVRYQLTRRSSLGAYGRNRRQHVTSVVRRLLVRQTLRLRPCLP